ncbi:polysaccharide biosynthesis tyrosine autokinase [Pedobacter frigoris]|uniref:non-specific protein-tyrosine kinase n=2 Tax=Pedobacter frigoris TaxID=2571272 RepID=A0A4U1CB29_9SPHI|nr:polysaccharide biosynthesis tyrosine autokinase [Pedobacter frigoris]
MSFNQQSIMKRPDLKDQIMKYFKYWYLFLITLLLSLGGAYLYLQITVPQYKVTSTLLIQDDAKGDGILKGTAFSDLNMFRSSRTVDNEMEVLRSKDLIYEVLNDLALQVRYSKKLPLRSKELYGDSLTFKILVNSIKDGAYAKKNLSVQILDDEKLLFKEGSKEYIYRFNQAIVRPEFNITIVKGPAFKLSGKSVEVAFVNLRRLAEVYSASQLIVMPVVKDANTIVLSLMDAVPQRGIDILERLIETYNMENVSNKNIMAMNTIKFIDGKLSYLSKDLSGVEQDVEDYKKFNRVTELSTNAQMDLQSSGEYDQQLASSEVQLGLVQSMISYLTGSESKYELVPTTLGLKDPTLQNLTDRYNNLQIERQRLLRTNQAGNPLVINITEQLSGLKSNLLENLTVIRKGLRLEKNNLNRKSAMYAARLRSVPVLEKGLLERSREQSVKTTLYHYLLQKREETELSLSATIPTSQVIDKPAYVSIPAKPKVQIIYLMSFVLGLIIPASVIYTRNKLNNKVKDIYDVEYLTGGARILGELSHKGIGESIVVHKDKSTTISELFRFIRSNLHFMDTNKSNQVMLVTSSTKGEGKTFFSVNLGITLSLIEKKVVMLEFDLRKPDMLNSMKMTSEIGLSDYLTSESLTVDDILVQSPTSSNLSVIGCGKIPENPGELLMSNRLNILFHELRKRFDYIIVDTSPVGRVADAFSLAEFADASIYVVRYNFTNKTELGIFEDICENHKLINPMLVFNDAKKENRNVYRYGRYAYSA